MEVITRGEESSCDQSCGREFMYLFENNELDSNVVEYPTQPKTFSINLYPHQLSAIAMMEKREQTKLITLDAMTNDNPHDRNMNIVTNVGIYADITGYGKTASTIGLIMRDKMEWNESELYIHNSYIMHYGDGRIFATENVKYEKIDCNIVLVSQTLIKQWETELSASNLNYEIICTKKQVTSCNPREHDVLVISPSMYNFFMAHHNGNHYPYAWKRFIFDEPQNTNISGMKPIMAGFNWFISATPHLMLNKARNRNSFITNMFHFGVHRQIFDALIVKNNDNYVRESYRLPETRHIEYDTYQPLCNIVRGIASDSITKMLEADNIQGAIKLLGGSTDNINQENIFDLLRNRKQDKLREIEMKIALYRERNDSVKENKWKAKEDIIKQQLTSLEQRISNISSAPCVICTDTCTKPVMIGGCCHIFCGACILQWLKTKPTCPVCRNPTESKELIYINTSLQTLNEPVSNIMTKQQTVIDIIKKKQGGKFIVFSAFEETFINIRNCLEHENITYGEISGKKEHREQTINEFKHGNVDVLFLNSINSGDGLNLQEATDVILYHKMSSGLETQIIGRANRIGRNIDLSVHHLN